MPAKRYYYSDMISRFLTRSVKEVVGELTVSSNHDINDETTNSWICEIEILQNILKPYFNRGSVYFEYNIPRMGRRADVIVVIDGIVFVLEFKTSEQKFTRDAINQVWDYALDLKNFQEGSLNRVIIPILVAPKEKNSHCFLKMEPFKDGVYKPLLCNEELLNLCVENVLNKHSQGMSFATEQDDIWAKSGYSPTPTIIEAAVALYEEHSVEDITKHDGDVGETAKCVERIINKCRAESRRAICFVTGVPLRHRLRQGRRHNPDARE